MSKKLSKKIEAALEELGVANFSYATSVAKFDIVKANTVSEECLDETRVEAKGYLSSGYSEERVIATIKAATNDINKLVASA